jgi:hypothetical protein
MAPLPAAGLARDLAKKPGFQTTLLIAQCGYLNCTIRFNYEQNSVPGSLCVKTVSKLILKDI